MGYHEETIEWIKKLQRLVNDAKSNTDNNNFKEVYTEMKQLVNHEQAQQRQAEELREKAKWSKNEKEKKKCRRKYEQMKVTNNYIPELIVSDVRGFCEIYNIDLK